MKKWFSFIITNFLGVLNDNFHKNIVSFVAIGWVSTRSSLIVSVAAASFVIPYVLFSSIASRLSKVYYKTKVYRLSKLAEIPIMIIASFGFFYENIIVVIISVVLMGLQSAIYSPSKYALIRDIGGKERVSFGSGLLEMSSFIAILAGTAIAGFIADKNNLGLIVFLLLGLSVLGYFSSIFIKAKEPDVEKDFVHLNPISFLIEGFRLAKKFDRIIPCIIGLGSFWLLASIIQMKLIVFGSEVLGISKGETGFIMAIAAVGIALGSIIVGLFSGNKVRIYFVFFASIGMFVSSLLIFLLKPELFLFKILIFMFAFSGGLFKIPLNAWIQLKSEGRSLGQITALNNQVVFIFLLFSTGIFAIVESFNLEYLSFMIVSFISLLLFLYIVISFSKK